MITRRAFLAGLAVTPFSVAANRIPEKIKVGVCTQDSTDAAKYGFDYIEPSAATIAAMSDDEFRDYAAEVLASPIRCEAFNGLIRRSDLKVVGNDTSLSALRDYLEPCL